LVLPFWYRLTQVVLEKRPLNGCFVVRNVSHTNNRITGLLRLLLLLIQKLLAAQRNEATKLRILGLAAEATTFVPVSRVGGEHNWVGKTHREWE